MPEVTTQLEDAELQYERAKELAEIIRGQWEADGKPLTGLGGATGSAIVKHQLLAMLQDAERDVLRYRQALKRKASGPNPVAKVSATVGRSPAAELRAGA